MKTNAQTNPLLCNVEKGICEIPDKQFNLQVFAKQKPVHILYFSNPGCSSCFEIESQLRKLKLEYGDIIEIEYRMGGLLPSWNVYSGGRISRSSEAVHHWKEVSAFYEKPADGDVWLEDTWHSSYPPSIAFKAAQIQDQHKALLFLRRIKEMVLFEKKDISKWEYLQKAAKEVLLDPVQLKADYEGKAGQLFQSDLDFALKLNVRGFPTLFFTDLLHNQEIVYGFRAYETLENIVAKLFPLAVKNPINTSWEGLFKCYSSYTTREFAALSNRTLESAEIELNNIYEQNKIGKISVKNGTIWTRKSTIQ